VSRLLGRPLRSPRRRRGLAEQLYDLAQRQQDQGLLLPACRAMGQTLFWRADFTAARRYLEQAIAIYEPDRHRSHALLYGQDPGVATRIFVAHCLWFLGYPDQALARMQEAIALGAEVTHPFSQAFALSWASNLHLYRREFGLAHEHAESALTLAREQGFAFFAALAAFLRGAALAERGKAEEGIAEMHQGLEAFRATGANLNETYWFALIAEAHGNSGEYGEGLRLLTEALAATELRDERFCQAELHRLTGKFLLAQESTGDGAKEAEACFRDAIEVAGSQNAKSWELRAATSLARLWQQQGKQTEAHELLSNIYNWFTEGFDTKDLQEAKALLEDLA